MKTFLPFSESYNQLNSEEEKLLGYALRSVEDFVKKSSKISDVPFATRDAHAESYGYLKGTFSLSENIVQKELFQNTTYDVLLRYSNANLKITKAQKPMPFFGTSIKINLENNKEINYPLVNFPVFVTNSVSRFLKIFTAANQFFTASLLKKTYFALNLFLNVLPVTFELLNVSFFKAIRNWINSYSYFILSRSYYSIGAYRLGNQIIKIKAVPQIFNPEFKEGETIEEQIANYLNTHQFSIKLYYQVCFSEKHQPVNNLLKEWTATPFEELGTIGHLQMMNTDNLELEALSFSPFHNPKEFQPVGKLQYLRKSAYETSLRVRNTLNKAT